MHRDKDEIRDYFRVIWKRKWLIIFATFLCVAITAALSFTLPRKWEVDCILKPSKFFIQSDTGEFKEITVINPQQISALIINKTYDRSIADELGLDLRRFPSLQARELRGTQLIRVSLKTPDVEQGESILHLLFKYIKRDLDSKIELEMKGLENLIENNKSFVQQKELSILDRRNEILVIENENKLNKIDIQQYERHALEKQQEIASIENLLKISQGREESIQTELKAVRQRIDTIEKQHMKALGEEKNEENALSLLLYSNVVQQNMQYYNTLDKELFTERINQENWMLSSKMKEGEIANLRDQIAQTKTEMDTLNTRISDKKNQIEKIKNEIMTIQNTIALLEERRSRVDYTQLVKQPTTSLFPVSPKRRLNVLIALVLGVTVFTLFAFFLEYTQPRRTDV